MEFCPESGARGKPVSSSNARMVFNQGGLGLAGSPHAGGTGRWVSAEARSLHGLTHLRTWRGICLGCACMKLPSKWKGTVLSHQASSKHGICAAHSWARWAPVLLPVLWGRGAPGASLLPLCWCELSSVVHRYTCTCYISVYTCVDGYICVFACWLPVL